MLSMRLSILSAVICVCCSASADEPNQLRAKQGGSVATKHELAEGVSLYFMAPAQLSTFDSVESRCFARNHSEAILEARLLDPTKKVEVVLGDEKGAERRAEFLICEDTRLLELRRFTGPLGIPLQFSLDLRRLFGVLSPGEYRVQVRWPAGLFRVTTRTQQLEGAIETKWLPFAVRKFDEAEIAAALKDKKLMITREMTKVSGPHLGSSFGTIRNQYPNPIFVRATFGSEEGSKFPMEWEYTRLRPDGGYGMGRLLDESLRIPGSMSMVPPGGTLRIQLPDYAIAEDGVFYYSLPYYQTRQGTANNETPVYSGVMFSEPVIIDGFLKK